MTMNKDEQMLKACMFGIALCAIATRRSVLRVQPRIDMDFHVSEEAIIEAREIAATVLLELESIQED
jgi:hypothetical protein